LGLKLILFVGAVLLVYTVVFLFFVLRVERDESLAAAEADAVRLSNTIRESVEYEMLKGQRESVQDIVEAITQQHGIEQVSIFNKDGEIVISNNSEDVGRVFAKSAETCHSCHSDDPPRTVIAADQKTSRIFRSGEGYRILGKVAPLYNAPTCYLAPCHVHPSETKVLGMMDVLVSLADVDRAVVAHRNRTLTFALVLFMVVSAAIGIFVHRRVHVPLEKLAARARAIAEGDFEQEVELSRSDDVGMLADSFNRMVGDLKAARKNQRDFQERLVQSVRDATAEVETKTRELTTVYEGIPDGIALLDRDMKVVSANPGFGEIFDTDVSRLVGRNCRDVMPGRGGMCDRCPAVEALRMGEPVHKISVFRKPDGRSLTLDVQAFPVKNAEGEVVQVIKYVKDITEEVEFESRVRAVDKMASIGQVAAGIAHGLNTPLATLNNGLYGLRETLRKVECEDDALIAEAADYICIMTEEMHHCQKVIRDLLDCARKPEPEHEPTDVKQLLASTINSVLLGRGVRVTSKLHQDPDSPLMVFGNSSYLKQAFLNILQNSYDAVDEQGQITITARRVDGQVEVVFEDTGCGMRMRDQERAFEPLFTTKRPGKGTGLGLAVVRDIIEKHSGRVCLESELERGTKVTVILPLMEA
jgi:PAS domain S-box-containing protein